ncbi:MAG: BACON domain-containing protein [Alistipes sp.]|nr:BACON domain-containing protein [Alistipes sp.]
MKKILSLIALVAVALTACETQQTGNKPAEVDPNLKIKLTSQSVMDFEAAGGEGVITYEFEDLTRANVAEAATAVDWIQNLTSAEEGKVTFTVAAYDGEEERSATVKVSYGEYSFQVMVKQKGMKHADVTFNATHLGGTYWGKYINTKGFNYFVILGDMQADHYQSKQDGATEYRFDIYSDTASSFNSTHRIPVGTYKLDHARSGNPGTIDGFKDNSYLFTPAYTTTAFADATLVVTEDSIIADVTFFDGSVHHIEYHGSTVMEDYIQNTYADVYPVSQYTSDININVTNGRINARYRGDHLGVGYDVWFIDMVAETNPYNGAYIILDLIVPKELGGFANLDGIVGEYKFHDENTTDYAYTIPVGRLRDDSLQLHAWYLWCVQSQVDMSQAAPMTSGTVKVTKNGSNDYTFEIDSTDDNGNRIVGTFQGTILDYQDQSCE